MSEIMHRVFQLKTRLRNLLAALLLAGLLMPTPAQAVATCTAPNTNGPVITTCAWVFLIYACVNDQFDGGNCSQYTGSWVTTKTCWKTWNNQDIWDNACNTNTVPLTGDNLVLGTDSIVTMDANRTVNNFQLNGGGNNDTYLLLNNYNLTVLGNFTNNSYPEWNCGRYNSGWSYQTCEANWPSMCEDTCDGHGWTIFGGSSQQTIGGTISLSGTPNETSFTYLEINNPAGVKLLTDVRVTGQLKLTSGFIDTNGHSLKIVSDCSANAILGSGYVLTSSSGPLYLNFQGGGTETCIFPVADGNGRANVTVTKYGTNKGTLKVSTSVTPPDTPANMDIDQTDNANHYWTLSTGESESYWDYAYLNGTTWNTTTKPAPASSKNVTGLSTSTTYDVTFQFCATPGTCTAAEKDGTGNTNVSSFILALNKTKVAGTGKWTQYRSPTNDGAASTTKQTGLTGFGWFNAGVPISSGYTGAYTGIKLNWKAFSGSDIFMTCGLTCATTPANAHAWLGAGSGVSPQNEAGRAYGMLDAVNPNDTWIIQPASGVGYTIASTINAKCLGKSGTYLSFVACNSADTAQQWNIAPFAGADPTDAPTGVELALAATGEYANLALGYLSYKFGMNVSTDHDWTSALFLVGYSAPPNHIRFEFDASANRTCQPKTITVKACNKSYATEPACTSLYSGTTILTPTATSAATWSGLSAAPSTSFVGSTTIKLSDPTDADVTSLSYTLPASNVLVLPPKDHTLECFDTNSNLPVSCALTFTKTDCGFDAVETGAMPGTNLFTKLASVAFPGSGIDVLATVTVASVTSTNILYTDSPTVELVDDTTGTGCADRTALTGVTFVPAVPSVFAAGKLSVIPTSPKAAARVRVRIKDTVRGITSCSSDSFTIRPHSFTINLPAATGTPLIAGQSGDVHATAFTLTATAKVGAADLTGGYTGTPTVDWAQLRDWKSAALPADDGSKLISGAFSAGTGVTAAGSFYFDDFGPLDLNQANTVVDKTFADASSDKANGDCISTGSFASQSSNSTSSGKYGCYIASPVPPAPATKTDRFRPYAYTVNSGVVAACNGFTYFDQNFSSGSLTLTAVSDHGTRMSRLDGSALNMAAAPFAPGYYVTPYDGATPIGGLSFTPALPTAQLSTWSQGQYTVDMNSTKYAVNKPGAAVGPFNNFVIAVTVNDHESARIGTCTDNAANGGFISSGGTLSTCVPPATGGTRLRYGMLRLDNVYGSELLPLRVPVSVMFWNGAGWQVNMDDTACTLVAAARIAQSAPVGTLLGLNILGITPFDQGRASIAIGAPGLNHTGSADIAINLGTVAATTSCTAPVLSTATAPATNMSWLRGNWCGGTNDPSARVTFGSARSPFLYRREKY